MFKCLLLFGCAEYPRRKMLVMRSFAKTKNGKKKNKQLFKQLKTSADYNEQELLASSLLVPPEQYSSLGTLDYEAVDESMTSIKIASIRGSYTKFPDVDRFQIGRYADENGSKKALTHFKNKFHSLKESTVKQQTNKKKTASRRTKKSKISEKIVNTAVVIECADALVEGHPKQELNHVHFRICTWVRSLLHRIDFVRRAGTT